jgi:hypothetical protein
VSRDLPITPGTVSQAIVDISGEQFLDLEREAATMVTRE